MSIEFHVLNTFILILWHLPHTLQYVIFSYYLRCTTVVNVAIYRRFKTVVHFPVLFFFFYYYFPVSNLMVGCFSGKKNEIGLFSYQHSFQVSLSITI